MIKIYHIITGLGTGGAERSLFNLLSGDCGKLFDHTVVSLTSDGTYGPMLRIMGIPVHSLDLKKSPLKIFKLLSLLRREQPDIIQGWMYHGNLVASLFRPRKARVIWNVRHGLEDIRNEKATTRLAISTSVKLSNLPNKILFNAETSRRQHVAVGFKESNTKVIFNGFDTDYFRFDSVKREVIRSKLEIPANAPVVGHIGRFHPVKDHGTFLDASLDILKEKASLHLILAGPGVNYNTFFFQNYVPNDLKPRVHLLGDQTDVTSILSSMDIFVQSSLAEGFPNALGEAMSVERPCIATDVGDSSLLLGRAGVIVAPADALELKRAIRMLLSDPARASKIGVTARDRINLKFPINHMGLEYSHLYSNI